MGPENVEEFAIAKTGGPEYEAVWRRTVRRSGAPRRTTSSSSSADYSPSPIRPSSNPRRRERTSSASLRQGFEFGWRGFFDDDEAMMHEWGFDPTSITVPVAVWFGNHDLMVPPTHGEWLVKELAHGDQELLPRRRTRLARRQPSRRTVGRDKEGLCVRLGHAQRGDTSAHRQPLRTRRHVPRRPGGRPRRVRAWSSSGAAIIGAPFDGGTSHRSGCRFGPQAIRISDYLPHDGKRPSLALGVDALTDLAVVDLGDVEMPSGDTESRCGCSKSASRLWPARVSFRSSSGVITRSRYPT